MEIRIREYQDSDFNSLNELLKEAYDLTKKDNNNSMNTELVAVSSNEVVGYLTINRLYDSVLACHYCYVNYVCVKRNYQHHGIATLLFNKVFEICKHENISYIELTSNPTRIEAHGLYQKLGFNIRKTDVFRKEII